jgi:hypothetical protein
MCCLATVSDRSTTALEPPVEVVVVVGNVDCGVPGVVVVVVGGGGPVEMTRLTVEPSGT